MKKKYKKYFNSINKTNLKDLRTNKPIEPKV